MGASAAASNTIVNVDLLLAISSLCSLMPAGKFFMAMFSAPPKLPRRTLSTSGNRLPRATTMLLRVCVSYRLTSGMYVESVGTTGWNSTR